MHYIDNTSDFICVSGGKQELMYVYLLYTLNHKNNQMFAKKKAIHNLSTIFRYKLVVVNRPQALAFSLPLSIAFFRKESIWNNTPKKISGQATA